MARRPLPFGFGIAMPTVDGRNPVRAWLKPVGQRVFLPFSSIQYLSRRGVRFAAPAPSSRRCAGPPPPGHCRRPALTTRRLRASGLVTGWFPEMQDDKLKMYMAKRGEALKQQPCSRGKNKENDLLAVLVNMISQVISVTPQTWPTCQQVRNQAPLTRGNYMQAQTHLENVDRWP